MGASRENSSPLASFYLLSTLISCFWVSTTNIEEDMTIFPKSLDKSRIYITQTLTTGSDDVMQQ